jgi:hypothetical protein
MIASAWGDGARVTCEGTRSYPETHFLAIDGGKARAELGVVSPWDLEVVVRQTVDCYKRALNGEDAWMLAMNQIDAYAADYVRMSASARGCRGRACV